jgi:hypothetical protein
MNLALRWMLILGCLMLAVLEAPRSSALVVEDLAGPYADAPRLEEPPLPRVEPGTSALSLAQTRTE